MFGKLMAKSNESILVGALLLPLSGCGAHGEETEPPNEETKTTNDDTSATTGDSADSPTTAGSVDTESQVSSGNASTATSSDTGTSGSTAPHDENSEPVRGAFAAHFEPGDDCVFSDSWLQVPDGTETPPVDASGHFQLVERANPQPALSCEYDEASSKFKLFMRVIHNGIGVSISMAPPLSTSEVTQHALHVDADGKVATSAPARCDFQAIEIAEDFTSVWGRLSCPELDAWDDSGLEGTCSIDEGYFYFENCSRKTPSN